MNKMFIILLVLFISTAKADISIQGLPPAAGLSFTHMETANTNMIRGQEIHPGAMFLNTQYGYINHPLTWSDGKIGSNTLVLKHRLMKSVLAGLSLLVRLAI